MQPGAIGLTALLLGTLALSPVSSVYAEAEKQQQAEQKKQGSANRECRRIKETGSRIAKRVCKKPEQWAREEQMARENIEQSREGANRNTAVSSQQ